VQINRFKNFIERVVGSSCEARSPPKDCAAQHSVEGGDEKKKVLHLYDDLLVDS